MENYIIIIEQYEIPGGKIYGAFAPDVPGCVVTGKTLETTLDQVRSSLRSSLQNIVTTGQKPPAPKSFEECEKLYREAGEPLERDNIIVTVLPRLDE